jgi:hypothetical protein
LRGLLRAGVARPGLQRLVSGRRPVVTEHSRGRRGPPAIEALGQTIVDAQPLAAFRLRNGQVPLIAIRGLHCPHLPPIVCSRATL